MVSNTSRTRSKRAAKALKIKTRRNKVYSKAARKKSIALAELKSALEKSS